MRALRQELSELRAKVNSQDSTQVATQRQAMATQARVQQVQTAVASTPPVTKDQVNRQIASAIDKEHHNDKFFSRGITLTPGGFLELAGIYRGHFHGNDISSSFAVNFPNSRQYYQHEGRFTARQSRVSLLA